MPKNLSYYARKTDVLLIKGKILKQDSQRILVDCSNDLDPEVFDSKRRKEISDPKGVYAKQGYWRLFAGGGMCEVRQNGTVKVVLTERDGFAPSYKFHLQGQSGVSSSIMAIFDPLNTILQEIVEEVGFCVNGQLMQMSIDPYFTPLTVQAYSGQKKIVNAVCPEMELKGKKPIVRPARIIPSEKDIEMEIIFGNTRSHVRGFLIQDPNTRGLDIYKRVAVELEPEDDFSLIHCETFKGQPLNNRLFLVEPSKVQFRRKGDLGFIKGITEAFQSGKKIAIDPDQEFPMAPVGAQSYEAFYC